ncbi:hypothetical protein B0H13DRAFT_2421286 [Mycena leptocephala]|nr:hypothetical protein B0H13DRAFT_2421286 [Mycena leptocephala]
MVLDLFRRQFRALCVKNWIVLSRHPILNFLRCFALPVAAAIFLSAAQQFLTRPGDFGLGSPAAVRVLQQEFKVGKLVWFDATDGNSVPSPAETMVHVTTGFSASQMGRVKQVSSKNQLLLECPQNFNGFSNCYAALVFSNMSQNASAPIVYTILADEGLGAHVDVVHHTGDFETRVMPLQWAVDKAIVELRSGVDISTPLEWSFTRKTNAEEAYTVRTEYINGITAIIGLAFFLSFLGIAYQLTGAMAGERASQVTSHMQAMGLLDSARIISTHVFFSLVYLPSWIVVTFIWHYKIWTQTNAALLLLVNILFGPQLAAVASTFFSILVAVFAFTQPITGTAQSVVFMLFLPPSFYVFALRAIDGFEANGLAANAFESDVSYNLLLIALIVVAFVNVLLWPVLGLLLERQIYDTQGPQRTRWNLWNRRSEKNTVPIDPATAVSVRGLGKTFKTFLGRKSKAVTAISDLTLDIPRNGIFILLGSNGAGKSTFLSILGGLASPSRGVVAFQGGATRPPRGTLGIVPQRNVLIPELSCLQTLQVWSAVKWSANSGSNEDLEKLLRDCDLQNKIHARAGTLSGGQKRKLQLAIGLTGGSTFLLATAGVDPLSRRALWRTLVSFRKERTILLTTHLLDECDLLADHVAILAAPGKLVASDSPVSMKRGHGTGYTVQLSVQAPDSSDGTAPLSDLLRQIQAIAPDTSMALDAPQRPLFCLGSNDSGLVSRVLGLLDAEARTYGIVSYDILGTTIEDVFLDAMSREQGPVAPETESDASTNHDAPSVIPPLANGKAISPLRQALIIFYKRALIVRRSWLAPLVAIGIAVAASVVPLNLMKKRPRSCARPLPQFDDFAIQLYAPLSFLIPGESTFSDGVITTVSEPIFDSPPGIISTLGNSTASLNISDFADNVAFSNNIQENFGTIDTGGVSFDLASGSAMFAWESSSAQGLMGLSMLNLATNILFNRALNASGRVGGTPSLIQPLFEEFPLVEGDLTFAALEWLVLFCAGLAVFPAFSALYVARERQSAVKTMQLSNGISNPVGLWCGHLLFDSIPIFVMATLVVILFAHLSHQFYGLGILWFIIVLYGIASTLLAYCMTLVVLSPLSAFAATAAYQFIMFILYVAGYLLCYTYANPAFADGMVESIHFALSLLSPVASLARAGIISVNLFSLLCDGTSDNPSSLSMVSLNKYGGPILYLVLQSVALFAVLFWVDSGSVLFQKLRRAHAEITSTEVDRPSKEDVDLEAATASQPSNLLQVLDATKSYGSNLAVDRLTFGVGPGNVFCMVGPNGAGKTTSINLMSGTVVPERGDVLVNKASVVTDTRAARVSLGVCPQFSAIDAQLSVREHLMIYGRLKGLTGNELKSSIDALLLTTGLHLYTNRLAGKLSGGNQRKLSLAIALIGNPPVVLIDEFSTGIDAKIKREMWNLLKTVAISKAFVITTHSMEEAAALATKVGILAVRLLAVGTTEGLSSRYATYEVHFTCRTGEDIARAERLMAIIPGARMVDDLATRFEVPIASMPLAELFRTLATQGDFPEYTIEKATLESMFLKVIRENNVQEEDERARNTTGWWSRVFRR